MPIVEKYCQNCKQNVYPKADWGGIIVSIFLGFIGFILLLGLLGIVFWLVFTGCILLLRSPPLHCPICNTPMEKLEKPRESDLK